MDQCKGLLALAQALGISKLQQARVGGEGGACGAHQTRVAETQADLALDEGAQKLRVEAQQVFDAASKGLASPWRFMGGKC